MNNNKKSCTDRRQRRPDAGRVSAETHLYRQIHLQYTRTRFYDVCTIECHNRVMSHLSSVSDAKNRKKKNNEIRGIPMKTERTGTRNSTHDFCTVLQCRSSPDKVGEIKTKRNVAGERVKTQ